MRVEPEPVPPERVREDDVGAGVDERAMDLDDPLRVVDVQQLEACADRLALLDQRRAHAAVGQERPFGEERSERGAVHQKCRSVSRHSPTSERVMGFVTCDEMSKHPVG